jgi:hypothetical protein
MIVDTEKLREVAALPRWKTQTQLHDPENGIEGNCTQAVFASIFGLELDEVPDFNTIHKDAPHAGHYWHHLETWVRERGFELQMTRSDMSFDGLYLADGPSPRGVGHFVVMKDGALFHDPHPSRAGITEIKHNWVFQPLDPAAFTLKDNSVH